ncbi:MAG: hypothetical protein KDI19_03855 [Pseudomonadales bacterium]|nr:hypothetical protein [Pseudomonadales bacterium]
MISLRKNPYPFDAMLAICSDLDETPDAEAYFETARFLNTKGETALGKGVGLEVGNTLYFRMPAGQFSWFNATDEDRARLVALMRSGHIDCLHSFGDLVTSRQDVIACWEELDKYGCGPQVWIDHAEAKSNFDAEIMFGEGASVGAGCYHADVTTGRIRYIWKGRVTSIVAKDAPLSLAGIFSWQHPVATVITMAKEAAKIALAIGGSTKYAMHAEKSLLRDATLDSGQRIVEFIRSNPSWGGVSHNETGDGIGEVLVPRILDRVVESGGRSIFYTHLGKTSAGKFLPASSVDGFRRLAAYADKGRILVTTTRRLLGYVDAQRSLSFSATESGDELTIETTSHFPVAELAGMCWYIPDHTRRVRLVANGETAFDLELNAPDASGRQSASIAWPALEFPDWSL